MIHIAGISGGKDSTATVILDHLHGHKIEKLVYCEVMFDKEISAEFPEHKMFMEQVLFPKFEEWGYEIVKLRSEKTFLDCFYHERTSRSRNEGKIVGFMISGHCDVQGLCKLKPIHDYYMSLQEAFTQYIGIASDEPKRLKTAQEKGQLSLLEKYGYTEQMAYELCEEYGLLSPIYRFMKRNGCFFCPNASKNQLRYLYDTAPDLFQQLLFLESLPNKVSNTFCFGKTYKEHAERFKWQDAQINMFDYLKFIN